MQRFLFYTLVLLLLADCRQPGLASTPAGPAGGMASLRYLALGDSYTIGQSVPDSARFPVQTKKWLKEQSVPVQEPVIIATTGWTTTNLSDAISAQNPPGSFDLVSLLIGVNDQYRYHDTSGYRERFTLLLERSIAFANGRKNRVFVLSIPDYSVTPYGMGMDTAVIRREVDQFNAINRAVTLQYGCPYLDITPSTREALNDPTLIAGDGLHPSGKEYAKWALRLGPLMKAALQ